MFNFVTKQEQKNYSGSLENRFSIAKTIKGTRSYHSFVSISYKRIFAKILSTDTNGTVINVIP